MKPYVVTKEDLDELDTNLIGLDDDMDTATDTAVFHLFPKDTPSDLWPEGMTPETFLKLVDNPVMSLSFAIRQLEEIVSGVAGRMVFAYYRIQLAKAVAAEPGTDAALYSTVVTDLKGWMQANLVAAARMKNIGLFFQDFHTKVIAAAAMLIDTLERNQVQWTATQELCDRHGISFDALQAGDPAAVHALDIAAVKDMSPERLSQFVFVSQMDPAANQDAVALAKERLAEFEAAAAAVGGDGSPVGHTTGSFEPNFGTSMQEDSIRV